MQVLALRQTRVRACWCDRWGWLYCSHKCLSTVGADDESQLPRSAEVGVWRRKESVAKLLVTSPRHQRNFDPAVTCNANHRHSQKLLTLHESSIIAPESPRSHD